MNEEDQVKLELVREWFFSKFGGSFAQWLSVMKNTGEPLYALIDRLYRKIEAGELR